MSSYNLRRYSSSRLLRPPEKKVRVSFIIKNEIEPFNRLGVNSLLQNPVNGYLYSAGRDSVIRIWDVENKENPFVRSLEHHLQWVTGIAISSDGRTLISSSSDTTIKIWDAIEGMWKGEVQAHKDHVKALAYARDRNLVVSGGLDKAIFLWDINKLVAATINKNPVALNALPGNIRSVYSLAINPSASVIASGTRECIIDIWDPRTQEKLMKLKGHTDVIKSLTLNKEGTLCLSGSTDGTIRLWSLGEKRCIETISFHKGGVWALQTNETFTIAYSGGKDRNIFQMGLNSRSEALICEETAPVLSILLSPDERSIWVSTTDSDLKKWPLSNKSINMEDSLVSFNPMLTCTNIELSLISSKPNQIIKGSPRIQKYRILDDSRHILTQDSEKQVCLWDVLIASKVRDLGTVDFEEEVQKNSKPIYVPQWFTADVETGLLRIHLQQANCFAAWVYAKDLQLGPNCEPRQKINLGSLLLETLLEHWPEEKWAALETPHRRSCCRSLKETYRSTNEKYFSVPRHTPLIVNEETNGRPVYRLLVGEASLEIQATLLQDGLPEWIKDTVFKKMPDISVLTYYIFPLTVDINARRQLRQGEDILLISKIIEFVNNKLLHKASDTVCQTVSQPGSAQSQKTSSQSKQISEEEKELDRCIAQLVQRQKERVKQRLLSRENSKTGSSSKDGFEPPAPKSRCLMMGEDDDFETPVVRFRSKQKNSKLGLSKGEDVEQLSAMKVKKKSSLVKVENRKGDSKKLDAVTLPTYVAELVQRHSKSAKERSKSTGNALQSENNSDDFESSRKFQSQKEKSELKGKESKGENGERLPAIKVGKNISLLKENTKGPGESLGLFAAEIENRIALLPEKKSPVKGEIEVLCKGQVLDPNMDLRTVKHLIWKSNASVILHYRPVVKEEK